MKKQAETTRKGPRAASVLGEFLRMAERESARIKGEMFPMVQYQRDPVGFVRDKIGEEPLEHQAEIMIAVAASAIAKVAVRSGQKQGKGLALDTPIPTPLGWRAMGDLRDGDEVYSDTGAVCRIVEAYAPYLPGKCYEIVFTDGARVVCDGEHLWRTWDANARKNNARGLPRGPEVRDTYEIARTVDTKHQGRNHSIEVCGPVVGTPLGGKFIPPYTLGVWLGDGISASGYLILAHRDAAAIIRRIEGEGFAVEKMADEQGCARYAVRGAVQDLAPQLRAHALLGAKRVPCQYLTASISERRALLAGLIDTDGTCHEGMVEFDNCNESLARAAHDLACSLGWRATFTSRVGKLYGVEKQVSYRVRFCPDVNPFTVPFKAAKWRAAHADTRQRTIKSVREIHRVPVRCVRVDSPSSMYLCTKNYVPTHNTKLVIWLAWWFWACFPKARVFMTASTAPQVNRVLWVELKHTARSAKEHGCDFGEVPQNPERGVESEDGRTIQGFTTRTIEAMAGLSGANMLFIGDEASSFEADMAQAIEGNTAGAARVIWISNPTRAEGPFFDAFHTKKRFWKIFHLNSEVLAASVLAGTTPRVPGIATPEVIQRWKEEYGEESPFYLVRVKGEFLLNEQSKIVSLHNILEAQKRWEDAAEAGPLSIGIDAAGDTGEGDEWAFGVVRGAKCLAMPSFHGLTEEQGISQALGLLRLYRRGDEVPTLIIDAEGPIGSAFYGRMRAIANHVEMHDPPNAFTVIGLKGSMPARRAPQLYERIRDELWASLAEWLKTGAIPVDRKLEEDIYAPGWDVTVRGLRKATSKNILREHLGRSPDRGDALCLAVWAPTAWVADEAGPPAKEPAHVHVDGKDENTNEGFDPFAPTGITPWG